LQVLCACVCKLDRNKGDLENFKLANPSLHFISNVLVMSLGKDKVPTVYVMKAYREMVS